MWISYTSRSVHAGILLLKHTTYVNIDCSSRSRSASSELALEAAKTELLFACFVSTPAFVTTAESVFLLGISFNCGADVSVLDEANDVLSEVGRCDVKLLVSCDCTSLCSGFIGSVPSCTSPHVTVRFDRTFLCTLFFVLSPATWPVSAASGNKTCNTKELQKLEYILRRH